MRKTILTLILATALAGVAAPSFAQGIAIGPGGVRVDPGYRDRDFRDGGYRDDYRVRPREYAGIDRREAVRAARGEGLVDVDSADLRGPRWIVRGSDRRGDDLKVVVDARTGDVVAVRRD